MGLLVRLAISLAIGVFGVSSVAAQESSLMESGPELWKDAWFRLTLADAYFGFLIVYIWVAYKEPTLPARVVWFLLFMALGNMAVSAYVLIQLFKIKKGDSLEALLLRTRR